MVSLIQAERGGRRLPGPSRLEIARHAEGTDAIGWVMLGFLLGAAAAIAALMHADFRSSPHPDLSGLIRIAPVRVLAPAPPAASFLHPPPAVVRTAATPEVKTSPNAAAPTPSKPKPPPVSDTAQVDEDAAAAGMTSHTPRGVPEIY